VNDFGLLVIGTSLAQAALPSLCGDRSSTSGSLAERRPDGHRDVEGPVNASLTDSAQPERQVDGFSLFAIGRSAQATHKTPEQPPGFCRVWTEMVRNGLGVIESGRTGCAEKVSH
jgi:hypothetical protein